MLKLFVGFDQREAVAYHVFCQSVIEQSSIPISFIPLDPSLLSNLYAETHTDGSNTFIYSRFLVPYLCGYDGFAIFADGDMLLNADINELISIADETKAVQVVKHNYQTKFPKKYLGNKNENYPRKNWSSLIVWNCAHPAHKVLTPTFIEQQTGSYLHRFSWIDDRDIGVLPQEWNWLELEYDPNPNAKLIHYTVGTPCFSDYKNGPTSDLWYDWLARCNEGIDK